MLYYGEIRQNVTSCLKKGSIAVPNFKFCAFNYNTNFTSTRVRTNITTPNDNILSADGKYNLQGTLEPIMYINVRPDDISKDYLMRLNMTFPTLELRTFIDIVYPDGQTRTV